MASANTVDSIRIIPNVPHHMRLRCPNAYVGNPDTSSGAFAPLMWVDLQPGA